MTSTTDMPQPDNAWADDVRSRVAHALAAVSGRAFWGACVWRQPDNGVRKIRKPNTVSAPDRTRCSMPDTWTGRAASAGCTATASPRPDTPGPAWLIKAQYRCSTSGHASTPVQVVVAPRSDRFG